jgi:uncharacterized alpha/beta hydrolase family protein
MRKIIIVLIILILLTAIFIVIKNDYDLTKKNDSIEFVKSFSGWAVRVATNSVSLVGNAIKMDWIPG